MPEQESDLYRGSSSDPEERQPDRTHLRQKQPDPMLQLSSRRLGGGALSLVALAIIAMLAIVFYGLNGRDTEKTASIPIPAPANSISPHG